MHEDALIEFLRRRSRQSFTRLLERERGAVLSAAWRVLADRAEAEDVAQEVFVEVLESNWNPEEVRSGHGWLVSRAVGRARTYLRAAARRGRREQAAGRAAIEPREAVPGPDDVGPEELEALREAVLALPEPQRRCVELRYFGGLAVDEVAELAGCARRTVHERLAAAREILRRRLEPRFLAVVAPAGSELGALPSLEVGEALAGRLEGLLAHPSLAAAPAAAGLSLASPLVLALAGVALVAGLGWRLFGSTSAGEGRAELATAPVEEAVLAEGPRDPEPGVETLAPAGGVGELGASSQPTREVAGLEPTPSPAAGAESDPAALVGTALRIAVVDELGRPITEGELSLEVEGFAFLDLAGALEGHPRAAELEALLEPLPLAEHNPFELADLPDELVGVPFSASALSPHHGTHLPRTFELTRGVTTELELVLPAARAERVQVLDAVSGRGVAGACVLSISELERRGVELDSQPEVEGAGAAFTDLSGAAFLYGLGEGLHDLEVYAEGYATARREGVAPGGGTLFELTPIVAPAAITVDVLDARERPFVGVEVVAMHGSQTIDPTARTDERGRVRFEGLAPGRWTVAVGSLDFARQCLERGLTATDGVLLEDLLLEGGDEASARLGFLSGEASWSVRLTDAQGLPVAGWLVHLGGPQDAEAVTNEEGRVRITGLAAGAWRLGYGPRRESTLAQLYQRWTAAEVELAPGEQRHDELVVGSARIEGRALRSDDGRPVAGAFVILLGKHTGSTTTDANGRFAFEHAADGEYRLLLAARDLAQTQREFSVSAGRAPAPLELELHPGGRITVEVPDPPPAALRLEGPAGETPPLRPARDGSSRWTSPQLAPGTWKLVAEFDAAPSRSRTFEIADGEELVVPLP